MRHAELLGYLRVLHLGVLQDESENPVPALADGFRRVRSFWKRYPKASTAKALLLLGLSCAQRRREWTAA